MDLGTDSGLFMEFWKQKDSVLLPPAFSLLTLL